MCVVELLEPGERAGEERRVDEQDLIAAAVDQATTGVCGEASVGTGCR